MAADLQGPQNSFSKLISVVLILIGGIFFIYAQKQSGGYSSENSSSSIKSKVKSDDLVNKYLREENDRLEAEKLQNEVSNEATVPTVGHLAPVQQDNSTSWDSEPSEDTSQNKVPEVTGSDTSPEDLSPREEIESQLAKKQQEAEIAHEYRQQYRQTFIDNAKKNGWIIKVDKSGAVTQSIPIPGFDPNKQRPNTFTPSATDQ